MHPNAPRIVNSILFVLTEAGQKGLAVTQYDIVKTVFLADRAHLNKYGRPITYDDYVAMKFGPVPSAVYDLLKNNPNRLQQFGLKEVPWSKRKAPEISEYCFAYEKPQSSADQDVLSESDLEELSAALTIVKSLGFQQIKKLTHEDRAYIDAWDDESEDQAFPMSYTLLFDIPNEQRAKELAFISEHL